MLNFKHPAPQISGQKSDKKIPSGLKPIIIGASLLLFTACASTTPYQQASSVGAFDGYSQTLIEDDRARVSFGGNSLTELETVENYMIYRTAELAKERGFDHFTLIDSDLEVDTRLRSTGSSFNRFGTGFNSGFGSRRFGFNRFGSSRFGRRGFGFGFNRFNDFDVREIKKYRAIAEVKFGKGITPDDERSFDADQVIENLGPTIVYPDAENDQVITPEVSGNKI